MREIEFRGKVLEDEEFFGYKKGVWIFGNYSYDKLQNNIHIEDTSNEDIASIEVDSETVGQYTGVLDKNGTKIFEGDILKASVYYDVGCYPHSKIEILKVEFRQGYFFPMHDIDFSTVEIVGNIHDNPELLEVADGR